MKENSKDKKLQSRAKAFETMNEKIDNKKVKDLERSIEYLNYFLSRKIDEKQKVEK